MREAIGAHRAETLKRDVAGRRREGEVADVRLRATLALVFRDQVFDLVGRPSLFVAAEGIAQRLGALAGLRAVRLVDQHREPPRSLSADDAEMVGGKLLDRGDNDLRLTLDRRLQLP